MQTIGNTKYSACSVLSHGVQQRATYQQVLLALRPQHGEVDHRSNHHSQHAEHERHQLLSVLLQHAPADVVDAEHCRGQTTPRSHTTGRTYSWWSFIFISALCQVVISSSFYPFKTNFHDISSHLINPIVSVCLTVQPLQCGGHSHFLLIMALILQVTITFLLIDLNDLLY